MSSFYSLYIAFAVPVAVRAVSGSGHSTRYWDCCKPSCAWNGKVSVNSLVLTCDANDSPLSDPNTKSGCDGGSSFTCTNNSPWAVNDNLAYGFAATAINGGSESIWCFACYALTFTAGPVAGKTTVVQSTNTGGDLSNNHFDLLMPGGGLGIFDGCTPEFGTTLPGERYGGNADNPDFTFEQAPSASSEKSSLSKAATTSSKAPASSKTSTTSSLAPVVASSQAPASSEAIIASSASTKKPKASSCSNSKKAGSSSGAKSGVAAYGQCDGWEQDFPNGALACAEGSTCVKMNDYYSQCAQN